MSSNGEEVTFLTRFDELDFTLIAAKGLMAVEIIDRSIRPSQHFEKKKVGLYFFVIQLNVQTNKTNKQVSKLQTCYLLRNREIFIV